MTVKHTPEQLIEVHIVGQEKVVAKISCTRDEPPKLVECDPKYEKALGGFLARIKTATLGMPEGRASGTIIRDGVRIHSRGEKQYAYALAHELTHHPIEGKILVGVVMRQQPQDEGAVV